MNWFNYYGLVIMAIIMIPNVVYAFTHRNDTSKSIQNKPLTIAEQIC